MMGLACVVTAFLLLTVQVRGHGMLIDPANRGSLWRFGYNTPFNYDDDGQYCGGRTIQIANGGKCGECGDDYALPRPRPAENGGKYGLGIIVATYQQGQVITATARITANHNGYFEFRLCPLAHAKEPEMEECFAKHLLHLADGSGTKYYLPNKSAADFPVALRLQPGLTCQQCVLQWTYTTGNSWGICANGTGALGCGPQETFRTCSDIAIQ